MTSQWIGDIAIDTKQSCDKQPGSFIQDPGGGKMDISTQKPNLATHHRIINWDYNLCKNWYLEIKQIWYSASLQHVYNEQNVCSIVTIENNLTHFRTNQ